MGLWSSIKDVLTKSPLDEYRDERKAETEAADKASVPDDIPEMPQDTSPTSNESAAPAPPADAPTEPEYRTYTVKSGDTLSQIGVDHGVDWHDIAKLNNLDNPDLIFPGQVFKIPNS